MIELPDKYDAYVPESGCELVRDWFECIPGAADRHLVARKIVESKTKDELIEYIDRMLVGVQSLGRKVMTEDLISRLIKEARNDG